MPLKRFGNMPNEYPTTCSIKNLATSRSLQPLRDKLKSQSIGKKQAILQKTNKNKP